MKKIFPYLSIFIFFSFLVSYHLFPNFVSAQVPEAWTNIEASMGKPGRCVTIDGVATIQGFECLFINVVRVLVPVAGIALFVMLIIGSFQLMTAGSDSKQAQKSKATITYAIIGLVVFLGIWLVLLLIKTITGIDVTKFAIPGPI